MAKTIPSAGSSATAAASGPSNATTATPQGTGKYCKRNFVCVLGQCFGIAHCYMVSDGVFLAGASLASSQSDPGAIRATAQMWRCSKIMHMLRDLHPTLLSALEGVVDQVCTNDHQLSLISFQILNLVFNC